MGNYWRGESKRDKLVLQMEKGTAATIPLSNILLYDFAFRSKILIEFTKVLLLSKKNFTTMTQIAIQTQVEAIKKATEKALQSKEAALKFLTDAGILKDEKAFKDSKEKQKK